MKMQSKLLLFFLPLAALFALGMSLLAHRVAFAVIEQEIARRGFASVSAMAQQPALVEGLRARDENRLLPLLQSLASDGQSLYALVQDETGHVIAHTNVAERGKLYEDAVTLESLHSHASVHRQQDLPDGPILSVALPVWDVVALDEDEAFLLMGETAGVRTRLGILRLGISMRESRATADRISRQMSLVIGFGCALFIGVALLFNRRILKPIRLLAAAAEEVRQGELGKTVPVLSKDEVGDLAESFNRMSQNLAQTSVSRDFLDGILDNMTDALIATALDGRIRMVNRSALNLLGYREEELIDKPADALFDGLVWGKNAEAPVSRGGAHSDFEGCVIHKNGERIPALLSASSPREREHRFGGFIITAKDMRERIRAEEMQRQMERQLVQSERMAAVGTVAAGIVHNLKNPLTGVLGFAGLLQMKHPELTEVDRILTSAENMNNMIENILSKSRQKRTAEALDLNRLLERELDFLMADPTFKKDMVKQVELADALPSIQGVYTDFSQALGNLLRNALEAMLDRPQKILRVTTAQNNDQVQVEIADTGSGISEEHLPHLFESFFTTKTGKDGPQGTGLGLYMTRNLLDVYGATIEVESEVDRGTVFRVRIPIEPSVVPDGDLTA